MDQKILQELFEIKKLLGEVVTKDEAKQFLTKNDAKQFATKEDLKSMKEELIKEIRDVEVSVTVSADKNKAEKTDLERLETRVTKIEQKLAH